MNGSGTLAWVRAVRAAGESKAAVGLCLLVVTILCSPVRIAASSEPPSLGAPVEYRPPSLAGAPRRVGGGLRSAPPSLPAPVALVPDHLGLTRRAQPVLYWFLSAATAARVDFAIVQPGLEEPLAERTLSVRSAGVQRIDLAALGVALHPGVEYEWSVALVPDAGQRSRDLVAGGAILYFATDRSAAGDAHEAAANGFWYDAMMILERSGDRNQRAALLEQVGMPDIAAYERQR
jgi:hypothetical protein